jgi:hypothetical protein
LKSAILSAVVGEEGGEVSSFTVVSLLVVLEAG